MGLFSGMKGNKAIKLHNSGDLEGAKAMYEQAFADGCQEARVVLAYAVLLIRLEEYQKAREHLVKYQKVPMSEEQKSQLRMNYAVCCYKLGEVDRAVKMLENIHLHHPTGLIYETLGYLYAEKYDLKNKPEPAPVVEAAADETPEGEETAATAEASAQPQLDPLAVWEEGVQKALKFNEEAIDYDDEDSICLDNMGQIYYRVLGDKVEARKWFDKAYALKEDQIDTLWFLSRYDLEEGKKDEAIKKLEAILERRFSSLNYVTKEQVEQELAALKA
ncbi:MAG: hypothetical protein Q4C54_01040 [Clostridia bacterium]|nr:hypothetical protein [Clostridia bacterium]